jgi:apolipoprotein N-acyltransferase
VVYPLIYTFYEFTQTLGWWGVPWARIPIALTEYSLTLQNAALFGSYFITLAVLLVNSLIFATLDSLDDIKKSRIYAAVALSIILFSNLSGGAVLIFKKAEEKSSETLKVGIVQGNYKSGDKWDVTPTDLLYTHLDYIEKCALAGAETVVLCETALPYPLNERPVHVIKLSEIAEKYGISILVGSLENDGEDQYNAIYRFKPDGTLEEESYKKRHLVPFGEYVPMKDFIEAILPFLSDISMLEDDVTPGTDTAIFDTGKVKIGSLICFDSIYEELSSDSVRDGATLLSVSTNDSWFGDSRAVYMHTAQARLRSVELSRYTVRSANTGLSCSITSTGEIADSLPILTDGYLICEVKVMESRTLYSYLGNTFVYLCGILSAAPILYEFGYAIYRKREKVNFN